MSFPVITIGDMVRLQKMLIDCLDFASAFRVRRVHGWHAGSGMGGGLPESVVSAIPIACTSRHSAQQIAFNEVGRQAIMADLDWNGGNYYGGTPPGRGWRLDAHGGPHHLHERRLDA